MIHIKKFNHLLNLKEKQKVIFLLFLILIAMFLETLGVGLIIPIFKLITDINIVDNFSFYSDNLIFYSTTEVLDACRWIPLEKLVCLLKVSHCIYGVRIFYGQIGFFNGFQQVGGPQSESYIYSIYALLTAFAEYFTCFHFVL